MPDLSTQTTLATFIIDPPSPFDFRHPEEWKNWLIRYNRYCNISGLNQLNQKSQIDTLIYTMGPEAERVFNALNLNKKKRSSYDVLFDELGRHFEIPSVNVISERVKFNQRVQLLEEPIDSFVNDLYKLSENCGFGALKEVHIRDRILAGMSDVELCKTLELDPNLTLDKAIAKITNRDVTEQEITESNSSNSSPIPCSSPIPDASDDQTSEIEYDTKNQLSDVDASEKTSKVGRKLSNKTSHVRKKTVSNKKSERKKRKHICSFCNKEFLHLYNLKIHIRRHTGEKLFSCNDCGKRYFANKDLKYHMRTHAAEKPAFSCEICEKNFPTKRRLNFHTKKIHLGTPEEKPLICCSICGALKRDIKRHMLTHAAEKPFSCNYCDKTFVRNSDLKNHEGVHTGNRPFCCHICGKTYLCNKYLRKHERKHAGIRPTKKWPCSYCNKTFVDKNQLTRHMRTHTGEKPFSCDMCDYTCAQKYNLTVHKRVHTKDGSEKIVTGEKRTNENKNFTVADVFQETTSYTYELPYEQN